jgi:hypothetical protein
MTDAQLLTLAISIVLPLSMLLYSNSRITDTKETLRAEIGETRPTLRAEMAAGFARIENAISRLETKLVIHELEHHK